MSTSTRARPASLATPQRQKLLKHIITSHLFQSPISALFFAERLYALDTSLEPSVFLLALTLTKNKRPNEAIWALRQQVSFIPTASNDGDHKRYQSARRISRVATECSLRCARLYAECCLSLGREKEGREVLAKVVQGGLPLIPPESGISYTGDTSGESESWVLELEMARLARKAGEGERAVLGYRKALEANPWCWEAIEGLCIEGAPPDPDLLFPPRARAPAATPAFSSTTLAPTVPVSPLPNQYKSIPTHPPPLGPSQTWAVNSGSTAAYGKGRPVPNDGFFTPQEVGMNGGGLMVSKGKDPVRGMLGFGAAGGVRKNGRGGNEVMEMSLDEGSFESSFYPSPVNFAAPNQNPYPSSSNSLFTPPQTFSTIAAVIPGKRPRVGTSLSQTSSTTLFDDDSLLNPSVGRRVVRNVPEKAALKRETSVGASATGIRRSSRLVRDPSSTSTSSSMTISRSQNSANGSTLGPAIRSKKRPKAGAGPSVLSDAGSDMLSPTSHSSSPAPSSPGASSIPFPSIHSQQQPVSQNVDPALLEAQDYVEDVTRIFVRAECEACLFRSKRVLEALGQLPPEQQKSWRCWIGVGKAQMEMLAYSKASQAFAQARTVAPHLLYTMELYSTLLWHLRLPVALSFLAQDLMAIAPQSPAAWIASGNVFSHLEDHAAALKCFKRAAQLEEDCVYAYTLSGHECVVLEEWDRALAFFREAVRRDGRHYNAWFGLGNVYMQTGKYRLAEYHFRKASSINPSNATLVCCVGSVLEKLGNRLEALELYEQACILAPDSPAVRFKRVRILIALKQYQLAESDLLLLSSQAPKEFNVHFTLGKLYKVLGKNAEMIKSFAAATDLDPRMSSLIREQIQRTEEMEIEEEEEESGMTS